MSILVEAKDPGTFFFDELTMVIEAAAMKNECIIHEREIPENCTPLDTLAIGIKT